MGPLLPLVEMVYCVPAAPTVPVAVVGLLMVGAPLACTLMTTVRLPLPLALPTLKDAL